MNQRFVRSCFALLSVGCFFAITSNCEAQNQNVTVQLPTFHVTGVSTTVVVPDRGRMVLGGVNRSRLGQNQFGPGLPGLGNRGIGRSSAASGFSISATIIDHDEIDRALLAEAARRRGAKFDIYGRPVADVPQLQKTQVPRDRVGQHWATGRNFRRSPTYARRVPY